MTSVEKRRSSRKSSGHRKHSDGGFSDTSSGGSFLDETDREVSNLTDRAFRSLCIGDEAVYNDSDLSLSSPSAYSDRQLAFCRDREEREREDRKRAAQENFNLSVQQYGQDWITAGMYGAEIQREAQWEAYGDRTQGMVSATFQHSLVETSHLGKSLREEKLSFHSNGATELSSQQRRSHSRVSSLIRAFNSDGHRDVAGVEDNIRERDDGTSWDKSALMSIQRELSEFSYQQNFNHHFHPAGPFSCRDPNFYSSEAEAVTQMSHSYMRSSQTKHIMSAQANCNSNFFIHSEFSPFQLWRDYNRFPFREAEVSGFMHYSEFPKWYQTPMYNELSLENQTHSRHRDIRQPRNHLGYPVPLTAPRSISTSSQIQRASAVEKRCESELAVHHPHRKYTQSLGTNKLPPHRPSTASPSTEMSRRVRDTISSVKALQQKVKMMSEYDTTNQQETFSRNESWFNSGKNTLTAETNIVGSNKANSFRIGQQLTPSVQQHQDVDTSRLHQHEVSPQPVEHPPVRAESRGATPDVRMSSYRSRATSLLFNLKDNRKRVKSTYSPTKFKGLDTPERNQQPRGQEQHETSFTNSDVQCFQPEALRSTNAAINQYHTPGLSLTAQTSHPARVDTGHYSENTANDYQVAQMQSHSSGFSGFVTSNYSNNHLLGNGQNPNKYFTSFTPYRQDIYGSADEVKQSYSAEDTTGPSVDNNQHREHPTGKGNATQRGVFVKADRYEQLEENKHNYKNVSSSRDDWRQASVQDTENIHLKTNVPPVKHETMSLVERLKQENLHGGEKEQVKDANLTQNYNRFTDQYGRGQQNLTSDKTMDMITTRQTKLNIPAPNENIQTNPQFEKKNQPNPTFIEENASTVAMTNQIKNMQTVDTKCEQVMASHRKPHYPQVEMAKTHQKDNAEPPKTEIAKFISSRQPAFEMQELHNLRQVKDDHIIKVEGRKNEQKEKSRDTYFQQEEEKQMKGEKESVLKLRDEPTNVTEKVPKKLKTERAEKEKLKEEHIKTELAKTEAPEQVRIDQVKHEQANGVQAGEKQQSTEKAEGEQMDAEKINMEKVKEEQIRGEQREQIKELQTKTIDVKRMEMEVLEVKTDHMKVQDIREGRDEKDSSHACQINLEKATSGTCSTEDTRGEKTKLEENLEQKETEQLKTENLLERSAKLTAKLAATQQARQEPNRVEQVKTELAKAKAELAKIKEKMRGEQKEIVRNILFTKEEGLLKKDDSNTGENTGNKNQNHPLETQTHAVTDDYERLREKYGFTHPTSANSTKVSAAEHNEQAKENKVEIGNNLLSIGDLLLTPETENKEGGRNFKHGNETVQESDCNEPLNKPQLGSCHSLLTNSCDKANRENVSEKLKDDGGQKSEKIDIIKSTVSLQKDFVSAKHDINSTDQRINAGKDMAVAPLKALFQREKAQTKQEILTSKIKAHAEKEISAIKEKGFALPEGFIGKSSAMLLASGQSVNIRQRPSSQEVPKKHETTVSNKITAKHQLEPSGVQKEPGKSASSLSSDTVGGEAAANHSEKSTKTILSTSTSVSTTNICVQNEKMEANHTETSGRLSGETQQVENDETLTKTKDLAHATCMSKPVTAEASKEEAHKDSESEDCVTQSETSVRDDSVLIMGIMVTVVERNPTVNSGPQKNNNEKQTNSEKAESNTSDSGTENSSQEEAEVLVKARDSNESPCVMKENEDSLGKNNFSDNVKETLNWKEMNREISAENADLQLNDCATNAELQKKRQPEAGSVSSKDEFLAKTQAALHQVDTILEDTKDVSVNMPKENVSETSGHPEAGDEGSQHEMQKPLVNEISHDKANKAENDLPMKDDTTTVRNISKSSNNDGHPSPVPEDNTCSYTPPSPFNDSCTDNTGIASQNQQSTETFSKEHDQEDASVHIDNIAIRVVPTESKRDNVDMLEKCDMKAVPPNAGSASEQNQVVPSGSEGKLQTSNHGHHFENSIQENSEQKMKDSLEEKFAVQYVLSSVKKLSDSLKASEKQNNANTTRESITAGDKKSESSVQLVEADYFQVQGPGETSNTSPNDITAGKGKDVLKLLPKETFIGTELHKKQHSDVFVFTVDPSERKTDQSSSEIIDGENLTGKNLETGDNTATSKQPGGSMESWNKIKNAYASQSNPTRTYNEVNQLESCGTERQNSGNQNLTSTHSEAKPNPRERVSAIPEISAIADYARLKVIVSEDKEEQPLQQFPPNKKEGFFPLIQTRHSRRPVFTDDPPDRSVKTQSLPNKTEITATVNKESKLLVFPIMEREHQRTGMFKLGDKERQEKTALNAQMTLYIDKDPNQIDTKNSPTDKTELVAAEERQWRTVEEEQQMKVPHEIQWRGAVEEQYKKTAQQAQQRIAEKEQQRKALHEKQQRRAAEEQRRRTEEAEQKRKTAYEEQQRKAAEEQRRKAAQLEQKRRIAEEEQQRKALHEEQRRRIAEEQQRRIEEEEQRRKATYEEQQRKAAEEQQRRAAQLEQQRWIAKEEQHRKAAHEEQRRLAEEQRKRIEEEERRRKAAYGEQQRREYEEQQRREAEEQRKRIEEEERRRKAAYEEQQRREAEEQRKRIEEEERRRKAAYEEQQRKAAEEQQRRAAQLEQQRRIAEEEQQRKAAHEEQQRRLAEEQQMRIAQEEQQRRAEEEEQRRVEEEQRKKTAHEEQHRRKVEEQQRRAALLEQKRRIAEEEQQRKAAEQQRIVEEEQRRKSAYEEQQRKAAEEKQRRITEEEQRKMADHEEQQRREAEEQQRMEAQLEQQRRTAEEQQRKAVHEEQQRRAVERQQLRASQIDLHSRTAEEEPRRQDAHKEQQRREAEVQQRRIAKEEQQTKVSHEQQSLAVEEQLRRAGQLEQTRRLREGPQMRKAAQEEQEGRTVQEQKRKTEQQQRRAPQSPNDQQRKAIDLNQRRDSQLEQREKEHEQQRQTALQDKQRREVQEQQRRLSQEDKQMILSAEEQKRGVLDEQERKAKHEEQQRKVAQKEQQQSDVEEHRKRLAQEKQQRIASLIEEQRQVKQIKEQIVSNTEKETKGKAREGVNVLISEKESVKQTQELNRIQQRNEVPTNESLVEEEKTASRKMLKNEKIAAEKEEIMGEQRTEKHFKQENAIESTPTKTDNDSQANKMEEDKQVSSLKVKARDSQEMDKGTAQKTDALQYFAITSTNREKRSREKQLSSPSPLQQQNKKQGELESPNDLLHQRHYRPHAAASPAPTLPRSNTSSPAPGAKPLMFRVKDNTIRGSSLTKSVKPRFHKNFGEDFLMGSTFDGASDKAEDDQEIIRRNAGTPLSRFASISESAALLSPTSLQDYSSTTPHLRPYSRRSMATDDDESRSVISSMSEDVESFATSAADLTEMHGLFDFDRPESACSFSSDVSRSLGKPPVVPPKSEKALRRAQRLTSRRMKKELSKAAEGNPVGVGKEVSSFPSSSSSSNEVCSSNHHVVASPHFSPPVAFALAPATGSSLPSSHKDRKSSHRSFHASPHATGPISIPSPSPHAGSAVSLHASSPASKPEALQTVAHVSSSPTLHHVNHPATPVTQYHVESTNYPLTQRKVLQDLGSGQFFVVDVPVQVKTKTFFDPETGKYVQLNVRQTGQNISQPQLQQKYQQPQVQQQLQVQQQPQSLSSVTTAASKPFRFYQGYHSSPQNYQAAVVNSVHESSSSVSPALHQSQQASRENHSCRTPVPEIDQNSEGHRYSPEKTPYMDTVNDITKTYNLVNSTRDSCNPFPECDTNSPLGRSSVCENDHSANLEYQPRDIITISELEDFMEVSDW
ncbi:cardiac-enriched FHL2-interacting protein [Poecilia reticulata]|uniref:cardiac-enriched FHL2-interacting protein n=1 Tax=Poecilia reticulata TaxID=8081 RepID=UPI0007EA6C3C|nr:PREDICTED: titin [Poecilia reticulata]